MKESFKKLFEEHAKLQSPKEAGAYVVQKNGKEYFRIVDNVHPNPTGFYFPDIEFYKNLRRDGMEIVSFVHSHSGKSANPSKMDRDMCRHMQVPWHIYAVESGDWYSFLPQEGPVPLIGREYLFGVFDCFTLVRDYYKQVHGIEMPDMKFDYEHVVKEDLYEQLFEEAGFRQIHERPQIGDCILIAIRKKRANHAGILVDHNRILHHVEGRLSGYESYGGYLLKNTRKIIRRKEFICDQQ